MTSPALTRLFSSAGTFVRELDLKGMSNLEDQTLIEMVHFALPRSGDVGATAITYLDLTGSSLLHKNFTFGLSFHAGCLSLTTSSVDYLLAHSPHLATAILGGLPAVGTSTLSILSHAESLSTLDIRRCRSLPPSSILPILSSFPTTSPLTMLLLGSIGLSPLLPLLHFPLLTTLDLSHSTSLSDSSFLDLVTPPPGYSCPAILLPSDDSRKVLLPWRHLNLTGCTLLTDLALSHLSHALPSLEFLELADIGEGLRTDGLRRLFETTPRLRRLDLEGALEVTDPVLLALSLSTSAGRPRGGGAAALNHLTLSGCTAFTDPALHSFLLSSPALTTLEADGTSISERSVSLFLSPSPSPGPPKQLLSLADARALPRRFLSSLLSSSSLNARPRTGYRGWWTSEVGWYHDDMPLEECEEGRVVVRSFYSALAVDRVEEEERRKRGKGRVGRGTVGDRSAEGREARRRAEADLWRGGGGEEGRGGCVVS